MNWMNWRVMTGIWSGLEDSEEEEKERMRRREDLGAKKEPGGKGCHRKCCGAKRKRSDESALMMVRLCTMLPFRRSKKAEGEEEDGMGGRSEGAVSVQ